MAQLASNGPNGFRGGHCCPICSQSLLGPSAKYHIKVCARHTLAQLDSCASCGRLVRKDDLQEHSKRCKARGQLSEEGQSEDLKKAWQERAKLLRLTLAKIEAGEIGSLDPRGFFVCSICGQQGLGLAQILPHEERCRERLSAEGHVPQPNCKDETQALQILLVDKLAALKTEVAEAAVSNGHDPGELLSLSLDRLRDVAKNACFREEKKYRRLRMSNAAVAEAIGRWQAAIEILEAIGFELVMHTSKTGGDAEPHLIMASQLAEATFKVYLDVLDGKEMDPGSSMLEECPHCKRKFRFDRIAKHETRCPESKVKPAKLDVVAKLLAGTPGEKHIPEVRRSIQNGVKLPPLKMKNRDDPESDGLQECARCKRRFSAEAMEKHARRCTATPGATPRATPRANSSRLSPLPSEAAQTPQASASRPSSRQKDGRATKDREIRDIREAEREREGRQSQRRESRQSRSRNPNSEVQRTSRDSRDSARGSARDSQNSGSARDSQNSDARSGSARPRTPQTPQTQRRDRCESQEQSESKTGPKVPGYPQNGHRHNAQPSYEQLELDVADWLDE